MGVEIGWMCFGTVSLSISFSLLAADAKEKQLWVTQLRACAKYHMETNSKVRIPGKQGDLPVTWVGYSPAQASVSLGKLVFLFFKVTHHSGIHTCPATFTFKAKRRAVGFACGWSEEACWLFFGTAPAKTLVLLSMLSI